MKPLARNSSSGLVEIAALWNPYSKSADFNATDGDRSYYSVDTSSAIVTATLPSVSGLTDGHVLGFKRNGSKKLVIASADLIDGDASWDLTVDGTYFEVIKVGSTWEAR